MRYFFLVHSEEWSELMLEFVAGNHQREIEVYGRFYGDGA